MAETIKSKNGKIVIDMGSLRKFRSSIEQGVRSTAPGPIRDAMEMWAKTYRAFLQARHKRLAKGGGEWPPLKKPNRRNLILRDTDTIYQSVSPDFKPAFGAVQKHKVKGIEVGFGGGGKHPKAKMTVARLILLHQTGAGRLPVRRVIVEPPKQVQEMFMKQLDAAISQESKRSGSGRRGFIGRIISFFRF